MTKYHAGYAFERKTQALFKSEGYEVFRPGGSRTPADLLAIKPGEIVLIQVKSGHPGSELRSLITGQEWNSLYGLACKLGAVAVLADWRHHRGQAGYSLTLMQITGRHSEKRPRVWVSEPYILDHVMEVTGK